MDGNPTSQELQSWSLACEGGMIMKVLWCWRCEHEMPMLDENEYAEAPSLYSQCAASTKEFRQRWQVPLEGANIDERFRPVRDWYAELTGVPNCHQDAIMHNRLSSLGNPCRACGKPL